MLKFSVKLVLVLKCAALSSCILLPEQMNLPSGRNMLMYSKSLQCCVEWVHAWFLEEQCFHMATRISGVRVARRVCRQDYAADSTSSSAERDLWQILYSGVILLCVMVLGNIREKWSASSQGWEGGWFGSILSPVSQIRERVLQLLFLVCSSVTINCPWL